MRHTLWAQQGFDPVEVDPALNPAWNLDFHTDRVTLDVQPQLQVDDGIGGTELLQVLPGGYSAAVRVVQDQLVAQGRLKQLTSSSNETVFFVAPRFLGPVPAVPAGDTLDLTVGAEFDLEDAAFPEDALGLVVEGVVYTRVPGAPAEGEFRTATVPAISNTVTLDPVFDTSVTEPKARACRLIVNGAESPPFWIELTP